MLRSTEETEAVQVMVNGKSLRDAVQADGRAVHLLAAMTGTGAVTMRRWPFRTVTTCAAGWHLARLVHGMRLQERLSAA